MIPKERQALVKALREAVREAADRRGGVTKLADDLKREGINKTVLYRIARAGDNTIPPVSLDKLLKLRDSLQKAKIHVRSEVSLERAMQVLSTLTEQPAEFFDLLPKYYLSFRRSFLQQDAVHVSHVEIRPDEGNGIVYREYRAAQAGRWPVSSLITGTLLHRDNVLYAFGLSTFRVHRPVGEELEETDLQEYRPAFSVLRGVDAEFRTLVGIHAGITSKSPVQPEPRPFAARVLLVETSVENAREFGDRKLLGNHSLKDAKSFLSKLCKLPAGTVPWKRVFDLIENQTDPEFGILIAEKPASDHLPASTTASPPKS